MLGKVQSYASFKSVYLKRNGQAIAQFKQSYERLENSENKNEPFPRIGFDSKSFNATLRYGMEQLNDKSIDDGEDRFLTVYPVSHNLNNLPMGYYLNIVDKDGNCFAHGFGYKENGSVVALKTAFDTLKENYKESLADYAASKYSESCSSVDSALAPYIVGDGPDNA